MSIRVLLADDQMLVREGIAMLLAGEKDIEIVGEATDGHQVLEVARLLRPDVVVMDVRMPGMDGVEATRRLTSDDFLDDPNMLVKVLMLTTYNVPEAVRLALRNGASGFALKDRASAQLVAAIRAVAAGDAWLDPAVTMQLIQEVRAAPASAGTPRRRLGQLTPRETQVLIGMARGLSNGEISRSFVISEATVKTHVGRIIMKLGLRDRAQAVIVAYESGLVCPSHTARRD